MVQDRSINTVAGQQEKLVPWLSGRTSVFDRWAFAVLRSTYSWRVTTYVGKPSALGLSQLGQLSLPSFQGW